VGAARRITRTKPLLGRIVFEHSGRWWVASLPSFPGAYSQGRTQAEAYRNLLSAIREVVDTYAALARRPSRRRPAA
jgi:predicted RNase H-like HicB family nuclease